MIPDKLIIDREKLINIANAIRAKILSEETLTADEIAQEIIKYTTDATASSDDLRLGTIAYANNQKLVGTIKTFDGTTKEYVEEE